MESNLAVVSKAEAMNLDARVTGNRTAYQDHPVANRQKALCRRFCRDMSNLQMRTLKIAVLFHLNLLSLAFLVKMNKSSFGLNGCKLSCIRKKT